jgi:ABC-2 type transport system ATP-binding protein
MIEVNNLTKRFGDFTAVDNVSFSVNRGELFALLGPNGAGKSTTIKMLTTLLKPTSGKLKLNGLDVVKDPDAVRRSFGIVFQDPSLDTDLTAYENMELHGIMYGVAKKELAPRIEELLRLVELWERRNSFVKTFSGGMKRRLEIARGLLHHPKVLFLDEPTLGLDTQTRHLLWSYVDSLTKEKAMTVLFTTHYLEEAESNAHRIAIIDHGKLIAIGSASELKKSTGTDSLEQAYLELTGSEIREEEVDAHEAWRSIRRARNMR